ncbi:hypothetical protein ACIBCO_31220 [Streptomyces violascens]|uniref:hypothetical protein n=1 Tax=Streptomyces violascens TaxID=67381 RepID=UPI0037942357
MTVRPRLAARIANRRAANWTLENAPWTPAKAARHVMGKPAGWGYRLEDDRLAREPVFADRLAYRRTASRPVGQYP